MTVILDMSPKFGDLFEIELSQIFNLKTVDLITKGHSNNM